MDYQLSLHLEKAKEGEHLGTGRYLNASPRIVSLVLSNDISSFP